MVVSEITLENLDAKIDALGARLDKKIDDGFTKAFEQTQGGFEEFGRFAMFLDQRLREDMKTRFDHVDKRLDHVDKRFEQVDKRFNQLDRRFDGMDERFDRLENLIKGRPASTRRPRRRT